MAIGIMDLIQGEVEQIIFLQRLTSTYPLGAAVVRDLLMDVRQLSSGIPPT